MSEKLFKPSAHQLSSNLACVLFSKNTPLSIRLFKTDDKKSPFQSITLKDGLSYFVAELSLGGDFYKQTILLKTFQENDLSQLEMIAAFSEVNENNYLPSLLSFTDDNTNNPQIFSPLFFCMKQNVFFQAHCETCQSVLIFNENSSAIECKYCMTLSENKKQYFIENSDETQGRDALYLSFANTPETPCINCENHSNCFNQQGSDDISNAEVFELIYPVSMQNFSLYGVEYTPIHFSEFSDLVGGMNFQDFDAQLKKQGGNFRLSLMEKDCQLLYSKEHNIFSALKYKLNVFLDLCEIALNLEKSGVNADQYMKFQNIRISIDKSNSKKIDIKPGLLPVFEKNTPTEKNQANLQIQNIINANNDNNTIVDVVMSDMNLNPVSVALGDMLSLYFDNQKIDVIVKQKQKKHIVLESINYLGSDAERHFLTCFSDESPKSVNFTFMSEINSQGDFENLSNLFFTLLLSNSVLGEAEIHHALSILFSKTSKITDEASLDDYLNTIIHTTPALSVVFRQENTLYQPVMNKNELIPHSIWIQLLSIGVKLSGENGIVSQNSPEHVLNNVKNALENILLSLNKDQSIVNDEKVDEVELIKLALSGIVNDAAWLDEAIRVRKNEPIQKLNKAKNIKSDDIDKTVIYPKGNKNQKSLDDSTLIMSKKR